MDAMMIKLVKLYRKSRALLCHQQNEMDIIYGMVQRVKERYRKVVIQGTDALQAEFETRKMDLIHVLNIFFD